MKSGIYKILNKINGKFYIGSASYLNNRKSNHKRDLVANKHKNSHLQSAFNKYGIDAFEFIVIEYCDKRLLLEREQYWLDITQCYNREIGYNILKVANSRIGVKHTEETKAKFKKAWQSENRKQLDREQKLGKKLSAEGKLKKIFIYEKST